MIDLLGCSEGFVRRETTRLDEVVYCCEVGIWWWRMGGSGGEKAMDGGGGEWWRKRWREVKESPEKEVHNHSGWRKRREEGKGFDFSPILRLKKKRQDSGLRSSLS